MASKTHVRFVCQECGATSARWQGKCSDCGAWNSFIEEAAPRTGASSGKAPRGTAKYGVGAASRSYDGINVAEPLKTHANKEPRLAERIPSGFGEFDRVLGGGFVPGSLLLIGGEPGIGKSTLLLQVLGKLSTSGTRCLYVSGEESGSQVSTRADRLGIENSDELLFLSTSDLGEALASVEKFKPQVIVVDSVQTIASSEIESSAGTVSQVREITQIFMELSKNSGAVVMLVGHVTKEGVVAGPRVMEHMVDGVFYFELASSGGFRLVRGQKNRFGATHELAVFEMTSKGLLQVDNPSARFLAERAKETPGSAVVAHLEGSRPFLTEVQALAQKCHQGYPRRTVQGVDQNRISVLLAVIERNLGISFADKDVYCKVASGARVEEPAADLPILFSLVSAALEQSIPSDLLLVGEVGLGGEIRSVPGVTARLQEAKSVGLTRAIVPAWSYKEAKETRGVQVLGVKTIREAFEAVFGSTRKAVKGPKPSAPALEESDFLG